MSPIAAMGRSEEGTRGEPVEVVTPEGVALVFHVAPAGERIAALGVDLLILTGILLGVLIVGAIAGYGSGWAGAVTLLAAFALRYGYFTVFEMRSRGSTPGKRRLRLRVVDAAGGPLTGEAVIVRNLLREVEMFIPLAVLVAPSMIREGSEGLTRVLATVWTIGFACVPLVNRRRLRLGDLFAGTMVVVAPRATLLKDLGQAAVEKSKPQRGAAPAAATAPAAAPTFRDEQLDAYGEYELQVLEDVLRRGREGRGDDGAFAAIAAKIATKIAWGSEVPRAEARAFLRAYYVALRARLERRMVLGRRKSDKHAR